MRITFVASLLFALLALVGCQGGGPTDNPAAPGATVTGNVTYQEQTALPADAVVNVAIIDVTGGANTVMGSQQIKTDGNQAPIPFEVEYVTSDINAEHDYALVATIQDGAGKVLFGTVTTVLVITQGHPFQDVEVIVVGAATPAADEGAAQETAADAASGLPGSTWQVVSLHSNPPVSATTLTAIFGVDGTMSGSDGCNRYVATYAVDASAITITPGPGTMMACPEPVMQQADAFRAALAAASSYTLDGGVLNLVAADGATLVTFEVTQQALAGTTWQAILYNNGQGAVVSVTVPTVTASFGADGTVSGFGGCNDYSGVYTTNGAAIQVGALTATEKACTEPAGIMEEESQFLAAFASAQSFQIEGEMLQMQNAAGETAVQFQQTR